MTAAAQVFNWQSEIDVSHRTFSRPTSFDPVNLNRNTTGVLISGARGSGVSTTLKYLSHLVIRDTPPYELRTITINCRRDLPDSPGNIIPIIAEMLNVRRNWSLDALVEELRFTDTGPKTYLIVIDEVEALSAKGAQRLLKSLAALQATPDAGYSGGIRVFFFIGGAVNSGLEILGHSKFFPCQDVRMARLGTDGIGRLHSLAQDYVSSRKVRLEPSIIDRLKQEGTDEPIAVQHFYSRLIDYCDHNDLTDSVLDFQAATSILDSSAPLPARFETRVDTIKRVWPYIEELRPLQWLDIDANELQRFVRPELRKALFELGYITLGEHGLCMRSKQVRNSLHRSLSKWRHRILTSKRLAKFLEDNVGRKVRSLVETSSNPVYNLLQHLVTKDLEGKLDFCYYATVESKQDQFIELWAVSANGQQSAVQIREPHYPSLAVGSTVIYFADDGRSGKMVCLEALRENAAPVT